VQQIAALCRSSSVDALFVMHAAAAGRQERIRRFKRSLWLSSRRGRFVEAIKRWLVQGGLWSSSRQRVIGSDTKALRLS